MNLDALWRQPLQSPRTNGAITQTAFEVARQAVKTASDYKVLNANALEIFTSTAEIYEHSDVSALTSVYRYDFRNLMQNGAPKRAPRLVNLFRFCEENARELGLDVETRGRLYRRGQRLREINHIVEELIIYRNYSAHHTHERTDLGLCLKVCSTLLRYVELLDIPNNWTDKINQIRMSALGTLKQIYLADPTNELQTNSTQEQDTLEPETSNSQILAKLDELGENIKELVISGAPAAFEIQKTSQYQSFEAPDPSDTYDELEYETVPELITIAQLRQRLLSIRKEVVREFSLTSDSQNLLAENIINEMLLLGVNNIQDWKKLPSTTELQMDNPALCAKALELFWPKIQEALVMFDWELNA